MADGNDKGKVYWLDKPGNVEKLWWGLVALCVLLTVADLIYEKHPYFAVEYWFGFYSWAGLVFSVGAVLVAKGLRQFLMRKEDYYDDD